LVVKKRLIERVPTQPGGGTVSLVTPDSATYWESEEHREEAGTPRSSNRSGRGWRSAQARGRHRHHRRHGARFHQRAIAAWQQNPTCA
jgi:selenocysteine lyase/cysteine desulfurase